MEVGTYHFTRGPTYLLSLKYDMDAHMVTLFGGEAQAKLDPTPQHKPRVMIGENRQLDTNEPFEFEK
jgi:hypothetical protein